MEESKQFFDIQDDFLYPKQSEIQFSLQKKERLCVIDSAVFFQEVINFVSSHPILWYIILMFYRFYYKLLGFLTVKEDKMKEIFNVSSLISFC